MIRRFVILGQRATASGDFLLDDLPGSSGRLDVLLRCVRASMLASHGIRKEVVTYLVLLGGPRAPRVLRVDGATVRFLRPDERSLAGSVKKILASHADDDAPGFVPMREGFAIARGGFEAVLADAPGAIPVVLDEGGPDIRTVALPAPMLLVLGDHLGLEPEADARLTALGALRVSIGPMSIHADDVVAVVTNELDRRGQDVA